MQYLIHISKGAKLIDSDNIICCEADNNYSKIYLNTLINKDKKYFVATKPLKELENILPKPDFFRCHKCYLINFKYFDEFEVSTNSIILTNGKNIKISGYPRKVGRFVS